MFRLHKSSNTKPAKSGERFDFKFSQFKTVQVPKGWDKLFVSIISVETGKTILKSSKAAVRNGNCQWADTFSESVWVSQDESSKKLEDCLFKFVVSMGSARSGILGEATLNIASHMSSGASVPVSFPLKKCNHGTILQLKIQCLTPRTKLRDGDSKETNAHKEDLNADSHDMEIKSEVSDSTIAKGPGSYSTSELSSTTHQAEQGKREANFSNSDSHQSYDSAESSIGRESFSPSNNLRGDEHNLIGRQDTTNSQNSVVQGSNHVDNPSESNHSSFNSQITHSGNLSQDDPQDFAVSSLRISGSSKSLLEAAEDTIEDLRGEAKMWERNARKLMVDLDKVRKEYLEQAKNRANLERELSEASAERDGLQKEVEQLKELLEKSIAKPANLEDSTSQDEGVARFIKELEGDIKFQEESNANLSLQLQRSQESNAELVSVLQELEETIEKQKAEIENLCSLQSEFNDMENSIQVNLEKNRNLMDQTQQLQESEKTLQAKVQALEQALEEKNQNIESLNNKNFLNTEREYRHKLSTKEKEIVSLKAKLSETLKERQYSAEMESISGGDGHLIREIEALKSKLQELESDCQELTDENLGLLLKLKETKNNSAEEGVSITSFKSEVSDHESEIDILEEKLKRKLLKEIENDHYLSVQELECMKMEMEVKVTDLGEELSEKSSEIERLEASLLSKDEEIENLQRHQRELDAKFTILQKEKDQLQENMEIVTRESDIATKCLNDLRKDLTVLSSSVDSHVSANRILERKSSELEIGKRDLELLLSEVKQENEQLSVCISDLEAQLKDLKGERESTRLQLENYKADAVSLQDEITRLTNEMETQNVDMKQKLQEMQNQYSEAQEEHKYLRRENPKLQTIAESLMEECSSFQKSNAELKRQKEELQELCTHLEAKLRESHRNFSDCFERAKVLEENISLLLEDSASREKSLATELDLLHEENQKQNKKFTLLNQMYVEKMVDVENLQRQVEDLTKQLCASQDERERIAAEAAHEVSGLRVDIAKLDSELKTMHMESEVKVKSLMDELADSKQNQQMLKADNGRMMKLLENYKLSEEKFKTNLNDLELKLTVSEYEQQQLIEESTNLKVQLLKIEPLQDEVLSLKNEVKATKSDKEKLETSLQLISGESKEMKNEKNAFTEKISTLQKAVAEFEECKQNRIALEEKLLRMEGDLMAKEALCEQYAELNSELTRIKRSNKQLQRQIQQLEEEKNEWLSRAQSLEEELILMKEEQQNHRESSRIDSLSNQHQREDDKVDPASKIRLLEDELAKAKEANNTYKVQLKRLKTEGRKGHTGSPRKSTNETEVVPKERFERTKSSLESELRDIRERYFHMSLKYAEVEAQREELVMKLKAANNGRRWLK